MTPTPPPRPPPTPGCCEHVRHLNADDELNANRWTSIAAVARTRIVSTVVRREWEGRGAHTLSMHTATAVAGYFFSFRQEALKFRYRRDNTLDRIFRPPGYRPHSIIRVARPGGQFIAVISADPLHTPFMAVGGRREGGEGAAANQWLRMRTRRQPGCCDRVVRTALPCRCAPMSGSPLGRK